MKKNRKFHKRLIRGRITSLILIKKVAKMPAKTVLKNPSTFLSSKKDAVTLEIRKLKFFQTLEIRQI